MMVKTTESVGKFNTMRNLMSLFLTLAVISSSGQNISDAATKFIDSLTPSLKEQAMFPFDDEERFNMNFVPMVRRGPTFHEFNKEQKAAALHLLEVSLSSAGFSKATQIMELERVLRAIEGDAKLSDGRFRRDPMNYHFCIFGTPSATGFWAWRFEGHHISLNFVSVDGKIQSSTPSFFGANPAIVKSGAEKGRQVLKEETRLAFELLNSFTPEQLKVALYAENAPYEIISGNDRKAKTLEPAGLSYTAMNAAQKTMFERLLKVYVDNYELGFSRTLMQKITKAGLENLSFAWAGEINPGVGEYYRIQGPMLLIEYDNTQNNGNHVHTVVRDLTNDFAEDILKEHYQTHHKK